MNLLKTNSQIIPKISFLSALIAIIFIFSNVVFAITPTLSVTGTGDGNTVQLNVTGDANASVIFYYPKVSAGQQISVLGTTNSSGSYSTTINSSTYGIVSGSMVYVSVGGLSGAQSTQVAWPIVTTTGINSNTVTLSQTGIVLSVGQSNTITATNTGSGYLYVSNNSNPSIANVSISGNSITLTGNIYGSTVVTVCSTGNTSNCPSIYVTIRNAGTQALTFSQNSVTIAPGQSVPITITGGNGVYTILNNSNPNVVQTSISNTIITLSTSATSGNSSITVCSSDSSSCGIINVTASTTSSATISFSQSSPSLSINQTISITISGGSSNTYYISANSNQSVVQANIINNNTLSLFGISNGTSVITVCSSVGGCGSLTATVNYVASGGSIALSQNNLTLSTNQTLSITVSGGTAPYTLPVASNNIFQASISGNVLTVYGVSTGSTQFAVCSASGGCTWLTLSVNNSGYSSTTTQNQTYLSFNQINTVLNVGQSLIITTNNSPMSLSSNAYPSVVSVATSGTTITLSALSVGTDTITVCQTGTIICGSFSIRVTNNASSNSYSNPSSTTVNVYDFGDSTLKEGSKGEAVKELQRFLNKNLGLKLTIDGKLGAKTVSIIKKWQMANGLKADGMVGTATKIKMNAMVK